VTAQDRAWLSVWDRETVWALESVSPVPYAWAALAARATAPTMGIPMENPTARCPRAREAHIPASRAIRSSCRVRAPRSIRSARNTKRKSFRRAASPRNRISFCWLANSSSRAPVWPSRPRPFGAARGDGWPRRATAWGKLVMASSSQRRSSVPAGASRLWG
jgi:hypothetical protein